LYKAYDFSGIFRYLPKLEVFKRMSIKPIPIRVSLLTYYLALVSLVAAILIGLQYKYSLELAYDAADRTFEQVADKLRFLIQERDESLIATTDLISLNRSLSKFPPVGERHSALPTLIKVAESFDSIYAVYIGRKDGAFYQLTNLHHGEGLHQRFNAPSDARWMVVQIEFESDQRLRHSLFYDARLQLIGRLQETTQYDPTARPWYLRAEQAETVVRTEPYLFSFLKSTGQTYAKTLVSGDGVLAIDISMAALNQFLAEQLDGQKGEIFLYDRFGEKYASSNVLQMSSAELNSIDVEAVPIRLTAEERAFVKEHPVLRVSNEVDWPPMDFTVRGSPMGYSIDLLRVLAQKTGFRLSFVNGFSWAELVELFKQRKLDLVHSAFHSAEREQFALFSEPFYGIRNMLVLRKGHKVSKIGDLKEKTVALPSGWATIDFLREQYPEINILEVSKSTDAYFALDRGEADATVDHELSMRFMTTKYNLKNVVLGPWFSEFDDNQVKPLFFMVHKDREMLNSILNKALKSLTEAERQAIDQRWEYPVCGKGSHCEGAVLSRDNVVEPVFLQGAQGEKSGLIRFKLEGAEYFGFSAALDDLNNSGHRLGLAESSDRFLRPFMEKVQISLNMALVVLVLAIPVILYVIRLILKPIRALMIENKKVAQRRYKDVRPVQTYIKELLHLSDSLIDMSASIQAYEKSQERLMDAFIELIADAIDAKSPYTAGHCIRVPEVAITLAQQAHDSTEGPFVDFHFDSDEKWREFKTGAWLHDCGKVTTPEYVVDKATKLETIYNRIHEVRTRFEVLWRDAEIASLKRQLEGEDSGSLHGWLENERQQLLDDFAFVAECNIGGEFMDEDKQERLREIAGRTWLRHFDNRIGISECERERLGDRPAAELPVEEHLLCDKPQHVVKRVGFDHDAYREQGFRLEVPDNLYNFGEVYNLSISRGTLTNEERFKINEHIIMTIRMLERLPLPDNMKLVPEYAGTHHETLIGTGYPKKLTADELTIPARIMTLADIFEALTASDRPYKKAKTLSEAIKIMGFMCKDGHIDADVFKLFLKSGVYRQYGEKYLQKDQLDEVDIEAYMDCEAKQ
jgi:HD-GYP domain-containing protein (c-di-GMP phosphodiesterase class II)/ABC-type amino acid transport substrate-binding protein